MSKYAVGGILNHHIAEAAEELKSLYNEGDVTFRDIQEGLQNVGLDLYLEDWLYDILGGHDD